MKGFACFGALPRRKNETAAVAPAAPQPPPDPKTIKRDAIKAAWQRMHGDDVEATASAAKKLRSYTRVRTPPAVELQQHSPCMRLCT
jgi:hypothetical protein